ncbi:hypothetical protein EDB85DRAFT_2138423 [Lactarius pseudohatsudake]|nr:hypothetical protein EDB85DRAFT_2138423 [Lactarius pseudohatsudake]
MDDADIMAAMGISGFGEKPRKRQLDVTRFDKAKRETPTPAQETSAGPSTLPPLSQPVDHASPNGDSRQSHPDSPVSQQGGTPPEEPEYDPDDEYGAAGQEDLPEFPVTHELVLKDHTKVISALALDPSGARIISGSHDYDCKLWDFGGMDQRCKPFKSWEPAESYHIHDLKYSPDGQRFLVISGTTQAKLYDRDGEEQATFVKGDPYIRDMKNTSGHVSELSSCAWHPKDAQTFITGSSDSTIRIWNVENKRKQKTVIVVKSKERGARTKVTACGYSPDGRYIAGACLDGTLNLWKTNSNFVRPDLTVQGAHVKGTETGSLVFSVDGNTVLTRGGDHTVKLWDIRSIKRPVATRSEVPTLYPSTNAIFSPDNKYVVTGAGGTEKGDYGGLLFMNRENLEVVKQLDVGATPVVVQWHPKINQIVVGLTSGALCVLYSPQTSLNGAKLLLNKGPAKRPTVEDMSDAVAAPAIIIPGVTRDGEFTSGLPNKRKRDKDRQDPRKSRRPELPVHGPGRGGRVGASATQHVVQNLVRDTTRDEDPREALLNPPLSRDLSRVQMLDANATTPPPQPQPSPPVTTNGLHCDLPTTDADSPIADSPDTPVNTVSDVAVKITSDVAEVESDVRHEPFQILTKLDDASIGPQIDTPIDPNPIQIDLARDPQQEDVEMGDVEPLKASPNGRTETDEPPPTQSSTGTPASAIGGSSVTAVDSVHVRDVSPNEDDVPPAKRARKFSDADQASVHQIVAHNSHVPGQETVAHVNGELPPSTLSVAQHKFALSTIRTLKKLKDAAPFRFPVDAEALKIPHYLQVIKHPMDFSTIERKLMAANPVKPDTNLANPRYLGADEFIADVRLIFSNCVTFNGPEHIVTQQGKRVEAVFDKQIKQLPAPEEPKPVVVKKPVTPPPPPPPPAPKKAPRRPSTSVPVIRRNETESAGRPKREIHPPPPKDLPYADVPKKQRRRTIKKDASNEQLRYCGKILDQLGRKQHVSVVGPFAEPVDWVKLSIPDYPKIVKKPMDLSTMRAKLDSGAYATAEKFRDDIKLIINNCFLYNPPGTPVHQAGLDMRKLFEEKWKGLPPLRAESEDEEDDDSDSDDERTRALAIATMESQIETMRNSISALKHQKEKKAKKTKKKDASASAPVTSSSKAGKKEVKAPPKKKAAPKKAQIPDDDVLSFEQKKDLSEAIQTLDGQKLERVIQIIHEGVPEIRDSQEEIELEIDTLPASVLTKLYNFVIRPLRQPPVKRSRTGKGTGTGGLKRKSMDEDLEAEKIRKLEDRMKLFEKTGNGDITLEPPTAHARDSEHSSDSSSDDDSSGSDSE